MPHPISFFDQNAAVFGNLFVFPSGAFFFGFWYFGVGCRHPASYFEFCDVLHPSCILCFVASLSLSYLPVFDKQTVVLDENYKPTITILIKSWVFPGAGNIRCCILAASFRIRFSKKMLHSIWPFLFRSRMQKGFRMHILFLGVAS